MERLPPDPTKLLQAWMEWERGETPPGRVMSNMKIAGMRDLLDSLAAQQPVSVVDAPDSLAAEAWTPVV
jgi:hypothetical protein